MSLPLPLRCDVERTMPTARVRLAGSLDSRGAATLRNCLLDCLSDQPAAVVIDIAAVEGIDDVGLGVLVDIGRRNAQWPGACLVVAPVAGALADRMRRAGVVRYSQLSPTLADATTLADSQPVPLRVERQLAPGMEAAALARSVVARACQGWGLPHAISTAQVVVSELVTNAVLNASTALDLTVVLRDETIGLSVHDRDPHPPRRWTPPRDADQVGRGVLLLDAFALSWGSLPGGEGKTVWATVPA